jgi:hypothetical protein
MSRLVALLPLCLAAIASPAWGAPWDKLLTGNRVDADPKKDYTLTEQNGPWMIMAHSFAGPEADKQARDLVLELRSKYKLPAYTYHMKFEFGETTGRGVDRFGGVPKMKYCAGDKAEETAVLVGDFQSINDPAAQQTLQDIKYMHPSCMEGGLAAKADASATTWQSIQQYFNPKDPKKQRGAMAQAFVSNNPLLPKDYYNPPGLDDFVVKMNEPVEYSLLSCPGRYTVQVAHFTGEVIIKPQEIKAINDGTMTMKSRLAEAADKAHRMTVALRAKGYEAYEFHDRGARIVTIGSFQSVGDPRPDRKIEINPRIHRIMTTFGGKPLDAPIPGQAPAGAMSAKTIADGQLLPNGQPDLIPFDVQPLPVEVPKRSVARAFSQR